MADDVREEAERLVAAAMAAASFALRNAGRGAALAGMAERFLGGDPFGAHIATGSAECCVCPVCRGIAAVRNPSPEFAWRVASGAKEMAAGLTTILRAVSSATARPRTEPPPRTRDAGPTWRAATRDEDWPETSPAGPDAGDDPWRAATTAASTAATSTTAAATAATTADTTPEPPPHKVVRKVAKKAVRKPPPPEDEPA
jgi:hypothetical protein